MTTPPPTLYDRTFFARHQAGTARSAVAVLALLFRHYRPDSVLDLGCGRGIWLATAAKFGARRLRGFDGAWARDTGLVSDAIDFSAIDLDRELPGSAERSDLAICLEVAEHLAADRAEPLVEWLTNAAPVVLFSAAIPGQGGTGHRHERWPSYWIELFRACGHERIDALRPSLWHDESIEPYYRQNMLLFVARGHASIGLDSLRAIERPIDDLVHPILFERKAAVHDAARNPTLRFCLWTFRQWLRQRLLGSRDGDSRLSSAAASRRP